MAIDYSGDGIKYVVGKAEDFFVDFNKTTLSKGFNATSGKIPVKLWLMLDFLKESSTLKLGIYIGFDKMYKISEMDRFLECFEDETPYYLSKKFIFEPKKMCFGKTDIKVFEFFDYLNKARRNNALGYNQVNLGLENGEIILGKLNVENFWILYGMKGIVLTFSGNLPE
ncbi:MAG: hypothetical protein BWY74_04038 [Firmicutes bacterium ADurb.Bin419]|nr:MAG: hypothetical protein BWY74_04038 [Firmicutes bacterium ADurb.Bin419]